MKASEIKQRIANKSTLYSVLAQIYYLPVESSHAVTLSYLQEFLNGGSKFYAPKRKEIRIHYSFPFRGRQTSFLLSYLQKLLADKSLKPTGFSPEIPPDIEWLKNVILHVSGEDKLGFLLQSYPGWGGDSRSDSDEEEKVIQMDEE